MREIDASFYITPQDSRDLLGNVGRAGQRMVEKPGKDILKLRPGDGRCFFPQPGLFPVPRTTERGSPASYGDAIPPNSVLRNGPTPRPLCHPGTTPQSSAATPSPRPPS